MDATIVYSIISVLVLGAWMYKSIYIVKDEEILVMTVLGGAVKKLITYVDMQDIGFAFCPWPFYQPREKIINTWQTGNFRDITVTFSVYDQNETESESEKRIAKASGKMPLISVNWRLNFQAMRCENEDLNNAPLTVGRFITNRTLDKLLAMYAKEEVIGPIGPSDLKDLDVTKEKIRAFLELSAYDEKEGSWDLTKIKTDGVGDVLTRIIKNVFEHLDISKAEELDSQTKKVLQIQRIIQAFLDFEGIPVEVKSLVINESMVITDEGLRRERESLANTMMQRRTEIEKKETEARLQKADEKVVQAKAERDEKEQEARMMVIAARLKADTAQAELEKQVALIKAQAEGESEAMVINRVADALGIPADGAERQNAWAMFKAIEALKEHQGTNTIVGLNDLQGLLGRLAIGKKGG